MGQLANEFIDFLKAIKTNNGTAIATHGSKVMRLYMDLPAASADTHDRAVATIIDKSNADGAFDFLAHIVV